MFHKTLELKDILIKNSKDMFIELFSVEQVGTTIKEYEPTPIGKFYLFFCCCYILIIFLMEGSVDYCICNSILCFTDPTPSGTTIAPYVPDDTTPTQGRYIIREKQQ